MSQHIFKTTHKGEATTVLMGWDKPLQGYFLVIIKESDDSQPFYSNLYEKEAHPKTLKTFLEILNKMVLKFLNK